MDVSAGKLIDALGGTSKVAEMTHAPSSTVHSWRTKISPSRLAHLNLLAEREGVAIGVEPSSGPDASTNDRCEAETGNVGDLSGNVDQAA